jgi:hypothetical protein
VCAPINRLQLGVELFDARDALEFPTDRGFDLYRPAVEILVQPDWGIKGLATALAERPQRRPMFRRESAREIRSECPHPHLIEVARDEGGFRVRADGDPRWQNKGPQRPSFAANAQIVRHGLTNYSYASLRS